MFDITPTTQVSCAVCGREQGEKLFVSRNTVLPALKTPLSICPECGFVYVSPRWTPAEYDAVQDMWFPLKMYKKRPFDEKDPQKKYKKWQIMLHRIAPWYPDGVKSLLDIGAAQGWCIEYLHTRFPHMEACAIERLKECREHITSHLNCPVIGQDLGGGINPDYAGRFGLIVFRHTLEHLLDPLDALQKIRAYLAEGGHAYIVTPSLREIRTKTMLHNYFRPVHMSYFCTDSLRALAAQAGLEAVALEEQGLGEVWGLFRRAQPRREVPDLYAETSRMVSERLAREKPITDKIARALDLIVRLEPLERISPRLYSRAKSHLNRRITSLKPS